MDAFAKSPLSLDSSGTAESGPLQIDRFDLNSPLPSAVSSWLEQHAVDKIFLTPQWFAELHAFQEEVAPPQPGSSRFWLVIYSQGTPLIAAPLEQFKGRLGLTEFSLFTNYYSPRIELITDSKRVTPSDAWQLLTRALDQLAPSWLALRVMPMRPSQQAQLETGLANEYKLVSQEASANHTVDIPDADVYWKSRSSRLNTTLKRKGKSLAKIDHQFMLIRDPSAEQIADYWKIYSQSWKIQEPSPRFINWLIARGAQQGFLRMGLLYVNGAVVACQLWLMQDRVGHIFKLAQNQSADQYSPGSLLTEFIINSLIAQDGMHRIDFLLGDDNFKPTWMDKREPIMLVEVVNSRKLQGKLLTLYYAARQMMKKLKSKPAPEQPEAASEA